MKIGFDEFWVNYPRKLEKKECKKEWAKIQPEHPVTGEEISEMGMVGFIVSAVQAQKLYRTKTPNKNHPDWIYPIRWLRRARWCDDIPSLSEQTRPSQVNLTKCACGALTEYTECESCYRNNSTWEDWNIYICYDVRPWKHKRVVVWKYMNWVKHNLKKTGDWKLPEESLDEWYTRCREKTLNSKWGKVIPQ